MILPLVGIVEFILYDCTNYFIKRHVAASLTFHNLSQVYGDGIMKYIAKKITKVTKHNISPMGT
jgi:hypothetical protein